MTRATKPGSSSSRTSIALVCVATVTFALASCSNDPEEPTVQPSDAKQSIIEQVEGSSAAVGGAWERYSGPAGRSCGQSNGDEGTAWVYILERTDTTGTDPAADVETMSARWKELRIDVEEFQSGGDEPWLGVRGIGGPVLSIGFNAYPDHYSITGVSKCSDGEH